MILETETTRPGSIVRELWPPEVNMILSAMQVAPQPAYDARQQRRREYRVRAELKLHSDPPDSEPWTLYTRDADQRGIGFITPHRLPLGYGGWIELISPPGRKVRVDCTLFRCRQVLPGWYEGALYFNREQWMFSADQ